MKLAPAGKDYLWGGERLKTQYNKKLDFSPLAETWECSVHPDGQSVVSGGEYGGRTLASVLEEHPEYLGAKALSRGQGTLPVLVKFIDAAKDLSVQVHPDDAYAMLHENSYGKSEMWYVLEAEPGAKVICGFEHNVTAPQLFKAAADGKLARHLHHVPAQKGDVFYIPAGTVHAIGAGVIVAEIQESSNLTYRLYDYNRLGKDGRPRALNMDKALQVLDMKAVGTIVPKERNIRYYAGCAREVLCRCKYFEAERIRLQTRFEFSVYDTSFQIILCVDGSGEICNVEGGTAVPFMKGDCLFLPADAGRFEVSGKAELLKVRC